MAMHVEPSLIGVDVSKAELVIRQSWSSNLVKLGNERKAIDSYLKALTGPVCLAVEATNIFHVLLIERAHALGHAVYVIDGLRLKRYRESIGGRAKTDASDAALLLRYLTHEKSDLRPWTPPPAGYATVQRLLRRRSVLVQTETTLRQSLQCLPELKASVRAMLARMKHMQHLIDQRLAQTLKRQGWKGDVRRCQGIEGIGPITAAALTLIFHRGAFKSADAYIAFIGLDVRVRESGTFSGRRKLTKKGDPELRRLLYMAAMTACRSSTWKPFYERALARGLSCIQALVALGRKLARIAFALLKTQSDYVPKVVQVA
ncbi:IS110 family transposase [Rhodanobacter glycinis]|uniref:IS110 family transposase n=1 Tax=Rhodanobacter glycinis TaxID=582702 RepID=A0A5B9E1P5_9GAMM|nr:transposase [Rhodanobacter glycinis]QEE23706.1 IS110 family transposase [Rhodanobacter glycinis]QEE24440.1 IS110 family transposase [Rhodanobacter glycinis]QEE25884.1 IS110 family transposase [Rhodanobacter glycinis]